MGCAQVSIDREENLQELWDKVAQQHIPLFGSIELTHRCNLRCLHCYLGARRTSSEEELRTERLLSVIDEITEAGCLFLLLTGGEPLIRKDFPEIYRHTKTKGLMVTVFTNGTMITDSILELFEDLPPQAVEISLYGATAATYEMITGVEGSFERCLMGIRRLLEHRINVRLKTVLMTLNCREYAEMERMAQEYGAKFRFDASISARLNGDKFPLNLRVSPKEAAEKEFSDDLKIQQWREHVSRYSDRPASDTLYNCGAGIITFHVKPDGYLQPCLMTSRPAYDLSKGHFRKGWQEVMPQVREIKVASDYPCNRCEKRVLCGFCPSSFELENGMGAAAAPSGYHCALSQRRLELISSHL